MKIIEPITVTSSMLTTNVVNMESTWAAGTYNAGDRVVVDDSIYEAITTTTASPVGSSDWLRIAYSNTWRMWTQGSDSVTTRIGGITATLSGVPLTSALAVLGAVGHSCQVVITDPTAGVVFDQSKTLQDIGVSDWWEYFFADYESFSAVYFGDLPPYQGSDLSIAISTLNPGDPAQVGRVVFGIERDIGPTLQGVQTRIEDYSIKERDSFGNLTLVTRRTIRLVDYDFLIEQALLDTARRRFQALAAKPTLFVGDGDLPETIVFGIYSNFQTLSDGPDRVTECSASVEEY